MRLAEMQPSRNISHYAVESAKKQRESEFSARHPMKARLGIPAPHLVRLRFILSHDRFASIRGRGCGVIKPVENCFRNTKETVDNTFLELDVQVTRGVLVTNGHDGGRLNRLFDYVAIGKSFNARPAFVLATGAGSGMTNCWNHLRLRRGKRRNKATTLDKSC